MAGIPGKSGGPRPNSGGKRLGAGRKPKAPIDKSANGSPVATTLESQPHGGALKRSTATPVEIDECDMLTLLKDIALGRIEATGLQVRAAIAAVQYTHLKKGDGGKKDEDAEKAKKAGAGKFAAAAPPKLVVNNKRQG